MSRRQRTILPLLLLVSLAAGCQPEKQLAVSYRTYTVSLRYLNDQREAKRIDDATWTNVIAPARDTSKALLDELMLAYVEGRPVQWPLALRTLREAMGPLLRQRELLEAAND